MKTCRAKIQDTYRYKYARDLIRTLSGAQAQFALFLINHSLRGYLGMPERQKEFIRNLRRAKKTRI